MRFASLLWTPLLFASTAGQAGALQESTTPRRYDVGRAAGAIMVDGKLTDPAWQKAAWTADFVDIEGSAKPQPRFRTRVKMLWDDEYLYLAAQIEEPDLKATLTEHDSVIFHDNDFEVFLKPLPASESYYEFEINALNTSWDLFLNKPYRFGGKADNSWDIPGLKTAVSIKGTLNDSSDRDAGWTVEIALPWRAFRLRQPELQPPHAGTEWRVNFSRVEWTPGNPKEDNWVWSPQGVVNMHVPERWGFLRFVDRPWKSADPPTAAESISGQQLPLAAEARPGST